MAVFPEHAVGDDRAFERLYSSYAPNVFRYALTVLGQQADAEDVTQTTFMNAYRAFRRGERPQKPEQWLITIAHNTCLQRFRHDRRRPREVALNGELAVAPVEDAATTVEELRRAFSQLPPTQRAALVMRELEGRSYADMSATLQISVSALETLLFRARRTLREQLEEQLSCHDAAAAIQRQLDGRLPDDERSILRAHLRTCDECAALARSRRARKKPLHGLLNLPFPSWVGRLVPAASRAAAGASSTGGMGAAGLAVKAAAIVVAGTVVGSGAYVGATHVGAFRTQSSVVSRSRGASLPSTPSPAVRSHAVESPFPAGLRPVTPVHESPSPSGSASESPPAPVSAPAAGVSAAGAGAAAPVAGAEPSGATGGAQGGAGSSATPATSAAQVASPAANVPPGQAKKNGNANGNAAPSAAQGASSGTKVPPGQAKKDANASGNGNGNGNAAAADPASSPSVPAATPAGSSGAKVPPGQAKKDAGATTTADPAPADPGASSSASPATPASSNVPPGQAKKDAGATTTAGPAPADPAASSSATAAPPAAPDAPKVPPGQAKKNG